MTTRGWYVAGIAAGAVLALAWWGIAKAWKALALVALVVVVTR